MNRQFTQFRYSFMKKLVDLFGEATIGGTGAPTLVTTTNVSRGIKSIVRDAAGKYTITLTEPVNKILELRVMFISSTGIPAAPVVGVIARTTSTIQFQCSADTTGLAADPGSGETMDFHIICNDSAAL